MRFASLAALVSVLAVATCTPVERGSVAGPRAPGLAAAHDADLTGMPDLVVDAHMLAVSWVVYDQILKESDCTLEEGGVADPTVPHRVVRFTVSTPNIGDADLALGDPAKHIDPNGDGDYSDSDGLYELSTCHHHWHFRHYATYELISVADGHLWRAAKRGFCMIDVIPWNGGVQAPQSWVFRSCGRPAFDGHAAIVGNQGIAHGWADQYYKWLGGQYFVLDGGDNQAPVPPGDYWIRIEVNPGFTPGAGEPCPAYDPLAGLCHNFAESDYTNNVAMVRITLPTDRPGKTGFGAGSGDNARDNEVDDENRKTEN